MLKVPVGALVRNAGNWAAFRVEAGRARLVVLQIGAITDTDAEILGGAQPGDQLILFPSDQVSDGVRVAARAGHGPEDL